MDETNRPAVAVATTSPSAVSWSAIFAGAAVAIATSLVLFALATGVDLAAFSGPRATTGGQVGMAATALIITQWISACLGGYVTGRLRTRWIGTHTHEVFFRDTAHGLITWCVATIFMASGLAASASSLMGTRTGLLALPRLEHRHVLLAGAAEVSGGSVGTPASNDAALIDTGSGELVIPAQTPLLATRTAALQEGDGQARFDLQAQPSFVADLRAGDDVDNTTRKDAALSSILTALSMLVGAFIASVSGAVGGRLRDEHP
jgi:hypothetical protein